MKAGRGRARSIAFEKTIFLHLASFAVGVKQSGRPHRDELWLPELESQIILLYESGGGTGLAQVKLKVKLTLKLFLKLFMPRSSLPRFRIGLPLLR